MIKNNKLEKYDQSNSKANTPTRLVSSFESESDLAFCKKNFDKDTQYATNSQESFKMKQQQTVSAFREIVPKFDEPLQFHVQPFNNKAKHTLSIDLNSKIASKITGKCLPVLHFNAY